MEKGLDEEPLLQVSLENKEDTEFPCAVYDCENSMGDDAEAATPRGDILELSMASKALDDNLSSGCKTPRESIFDPFAPGPEEVACAPKKKVTRGAEVLSRRQLNFDSGDYPVKRLNFDWDDCENDDEIFHVIQKMIVDLLISDCSLDHLKATENHLIDSSPDDNVVTDLDPEEGCKTPVSRPLLTGIESTCPHAPLRPSYKVLKLSPSICRQIDFDSLSDSVSPRSSIVKEDNR